MESIMGAFRVNRQAPYPWARAISSGLSAVIPVLVGIAVGQFTYGLLATMGGFAYLYSSNEPYARRGIQLLLVMIGMALCFGVGSLSSAQSVWTASIVLGVVSAASVFICEALDVPPPSALFFILTCATGTSMPTADPAALFARVALIFLGGIPAWLIAMSGWVLDPHGPETKAVADTYRALASWLSTIGTKQFHGAQHRAAVAMRTSEKVLAASSIPRRRPTVFHRLIRLDEQADAIFLAIIALSADTNAPVDARLTAAVRALADVITDSDRAASLIVPQPARSSAAVERLYRELSAAVAIAADEQPPPVPNTHARGVTIRTAFAGAFDRRSLIVPKALRLGALLIVTYLVASVWHMEHPAWVFFSTAAVMMGPTVTATLHRAVQRTAGTIAGAVLSSVIFALRPSPLLIAATAMVLQSAAQLMIVRNYALTVAFVTPLGLLIAHAGHPEFSPNYLVTARLVDILLGCALGLAGTLLIGRRSSSRLLPVLLSDTLRRQGRFVEALHADYGRAQETDRHNLQTSLVNLRVVYDAATNELLRDRSQVDCLLPAVVAVQRLGFFLIALTDHERRQRISKESLARLQRVFDALACAVAGGRPPEVEPALVIPEHPIIGQELHEISRGLQVLTP